MKWRGQSLRWDGLWCRGFCAGKRLFFTETGQQQEKFIPSSTGEALQALRADELLLVCLHKRQLSSGSCALCWSLNGVRDRKELKGGKL